MRLFLILLLLSSSLAADHNDEDIIDRSNVIYPPDAFYNSHITSQRTLVIGQQLYPAMTHSFVLIHHWQRIIANGEPAVCCNPYSPMNMLSYIYKMGLCLAGWLLGDGAPT